MFKLHKVVSLSLVFFCGGTIIPDNPLFNQEVKAATAKIVTVDPSLQYQTMDGWGTSLAWWGKLVGEWKNEEQKREIMDLTFDKDKGLGLNMVRYNIGGAKSPNDKNLRPGGDVESYILEDGTYDWTKDAGQRWVLDQAKKKIAADEFKAEAFSNSPPYFMTISGQSSGNVGGKSNLKPDQFQNFADYLTTVVEHFKSDYGITFNTIDPMNEPSTNYWKKDGNQEGCDFDSAAEKDTIFQDLSNNFKNKGINTKLAGFDETGINKTYDTIKSADSKTIDAIDQFNTHVYSDGSRTKLRDLAASLGKPLYMDEICTSGGAKHDANDMDNGLALSNFIFKDLRDMKTPGWDIWQVVDDEGMNKTNNSNWGLISAYWSGTDAEKFFITKQYYAMAHFSKYIRPGYKIIEANNSDVVAAIDPASHKLVLVTRNTSTSDQPLNVDLSRFNTKSSTVKAYRTTAAESLKDISNGVEMSNGNLKDTLPAKSMVTYVISNAEYNGESGTTVNDNVIGTKVNQFHYSDSSWNFYDAQNSAYNSDVHYSNNKDSYYEMKFNGNRIKLYGTFNSDAGIAGISIDGNAETKVDLYSSNRRDNVLMYTSPLLEGGSEHTVKVRITGEKNPASSSTFVVADRAVAIQNSKDDVIVQNPQLTQLISGYNSLNVKFNPVEGATSYNVKYGTASGDYKKVINNLTDTSYLITGLENGTKYFVTVSAIINGKESANSNELAEIPVAPKDQNLLYYVNCGDETPEVLEKDEILGTNNSNQDQAYSIDSLTGKKWGYIADDNSFWSQDKEASVGSNYGCLRQYNSSTPGKGLTYKFEVPNGKYNVIMGFYDPWAHDNRLEDIVINSKVVATELCPNKIGMTPQSYVGEVTDGVLSVRAQNSIDAKDNPLISWIKVTKANHNVKYYANGGEGTVPLDANNYGSKDKVTVQGNTLTRTGYTFAGWNTKADGSGTNYDPADAISNSFTIGESDVTLYAQWKANAAEITTPTAVEVKIADDIVKAELKQKDGSEYITGEDVVYSWYRNGEIIDGENRSIYKLSDKDKGKKISVRVEKYKLKSDEIEIPKDEPIPTNDVTTPAAVVLKIDDDTVKAGLKKADGSGFIPQDNVIYKWYRNGELIDGENKNIYKLSDKDKGKKIRVKVEKYGLISEELEIPKDGEVPIPEVILPTAVKIDGIEKVNNILEAQILKSDGEKFTDATDITYKWYRLINKDSQTGTLLGSDKNYKLIQGDVGNYIKVVAVYKGKTFEAITSKIENVVIDNGSNSSSHKKSKSSSSSSSNSTDNTTTTTVPGNETASKSGNLPSNESNNSWKNNGENTWTYIKNGAPAIGWNNINGLWYLMDSEGIMQTGWHKSGDDWYYLNSDGAMKIGWQKIEGNWYFLNGDGAMATGWKQVGDNWYFLNNDGSMAMNTVIDGYKLDYDGAWVG